MGDEYECQYTSDQIRKKHKCWHDGRLKLRDDGKVVLYADDGSKLSVKREIAKWLDPRRFNQEFQFCSRFVVMITSQDEKPSLALPMKPFKTPRTLPTNAAARPVQPARPARRNRVVQQERAPPRKLRTRIRHVQAEPIRI
ncbi:hypothetical protein ZYGR_0AF04540 [Zygosaccharomyces rouxii]|uniref:5'-3' DNA helicase ZGRF1-like N-terminal domain-containing protein n=1 Tax=Zygosaccharomyces rouxii TaxID=4956 RepID=A0A1Q3A8C7_ZYGRO|nr:hypothetical protein ZYGR_0AF04540 [Zygosaccharomyces rouxii]